LSTYVLTERKRERKGMEYAGINRDLDLRRSEFRKLKQIGISAFRETQIHMK